MPKNAMSVREAEKIAQQIADEQNVELVDVELVKEPTGHFLRFYIEKPDGISLNELETYHRRIQPLVENVEYDFMEVSSPGADRPLKTERDFERAEGMEVELKTYRPVNGAKQFLGDLIGLKAGVISIITESGDFSARLPKLFHKAFGVKFDRVPEEKAGKGKLIFGITEPDKLEKIINILGYDVRQLTSLHVNFGLLEEDCCRTAFLRGAFLAGGSVTDPEKRYHLELATSHVPASREVQALMEEMGFLPRTIRRGADALLYFKQSEHIEDFLTKIGAPAAAMDIMTAKVDKEIRNGANRAMNCDMANVNKTLDAAQEQMSAIERLRGSARWDRLPEKLRQTAELRLEYPELSLMQLAEKCDPPVTKSCMNHRMRKLMEEAKEL